MSRQASIMGNDGHRIERSTMARMNYCITSGPYEASGIVIAETWLEDDAVALAIEHARYNVEGVVVRVYHTEPHRKPVLCHAYLPKGE